ncbi:NAD(P)H-binding protein [bacterium]|nr:NAD(P)H-binding protein [bacterium]MBU1880742.1 NAD(P)H-binding protein [bacterium]
MKIFLTGATGFVGRNLAAELLHRGHQVVALVRRSSSVEGVTELIGDVTNPDSIDLDAIKTCDAANHLVGIIRQFPKEGITFDKLHTEATQNVLWACREAGVKRYIHMSALGADKKSSACYHRTKAEAEEAVQQSDLDWTIIRPSMILGSDGEFYQMVRKMIKLGVVPLIGDGSAPMAPLAISTVCEAFANALEKPESIGQSYDFGGEVVTYRQMVGALAKAMEKRCIFINNPVKVMQFLASKLDQFRQFPLSRGQINMLIEAKSPADNRIYADLGLDFKAMKQVAQEIVNA